MFNAILLERHGNMTVRIARSTLNCKDGLALTGRGHVASR